MKLLEIYKRIGKQPLKDTRKTDAIVFINEKEYKISKIKYNNGKFIGFEVENNEWNDCNTLPIEHRWIIVRDINGNEYDNHQWTGICWYRYIINDNGTYDGWRTSVDIIGWKYDRKGEMI